MEGKGCIVVLPWKHYPIGYPCYPWKTTRTLYPKKMLPDSALIYDYYFNGSGGGGGGGGGYVSLWIALISPLLPVPVVFSNVKFLGQIPAGAGLVYLALQQTQGKG